jgi:hypothetical protein
LSDPSGKTTATGQAEVQLEIERIIVLPRLGETIYLSLVDILKMSALNYRLDILLSSSEVLSIFDLGYKFDDLVVRLTRARNALIMKYLLMNESIRMPAVSGRLESSTSNGESESFENCELLMYDTSMIFNPPNAEPIRVHYTRILNSDAADYALSVQTKSGHHLRFSQMGKDFESTVAEFSRAMNELSLRSQSLVKDLVPLANPLAVREAARLLGDGLAAKRSDLDAIAPEIWYGLEKKFGATSMWDGYQFLKSMARQERMAGGIKRGLMGDLTGYYVWVLAPIYGSGQMGNAIAMEAVNISDEKMTDQIIEPANAGAVGATYFFRLVGRQEYSKLSSAELDARCDELISHLNELMLDINFRREPIYLSEKELSDPKNAKYQYAAQKIPALKEMRGLYIGRVIHSSLDQWKKDVQDLLTFNISSNDDLARWKAD